MSRKPESGPTEVVGGSLLDTALRRYWILIGLVIVLCLGVAVASTQLVPTTYTARASLIVSSNNRAPDQDAVLVQGYVDYFNDAAFQARLVQVADVSGPVTLEARAAASSPIMIVEATMTSREQVQQAAAQIAAAFRDEINSVGTARRQASIRDLESRIYEARQRGDDEAIPALQTQITTLQDDQTNVLQELQFDGGGVSTNVPDVVRSAVVGGAGGLVLGVLLALGLQWLFGGAKRTRRRRR